MKPIGGFFEIETPHHGTRIHPNAIALNTGRACISVLLKELRPKKVYVPFYTCNATYDPFITNDIEFEFYSINEEMNPINYPDLKRDEYFYWTNYFGLMFEATEKLKKKHGKKLIIDDTHAFFTGAHTGFWSFTSARKYFGVPDGAYLYTPFEVKVNAQRFTSISIDHIMLRKIGRQADAYDANLRYESTLNSEIFRISNFSEGLLKGVDLEEVSQKRRKNFIYLHDRLGMNNEFKFYLTNRDIPFCYPYLPKKPIERRKLYDQNIFVPSFWLDTIARNENGFSWERKISLELLPLPIDHRYDEKDMLRMVQIIRSTS